jgi:telomerase reverse transcriptase
MLLGKEGERIMLDLLVDCAVFRLVKAGKGNLYQLVGTPVSELEPLTRLGDEEGPPKNTELRPSEISFVRSRMLYARAALNARGLVHFGLRHIRMSAPISRHHNNPMLTLPDVLNRFPSKDQPAAAGDRPDESVVHIMMYIFPRQFGLHNVFTSTVDRRQTSQKFQDYTLREEEIAGKLPPPAGGGKPVKHVPKRLRGDVVNLVRRLQVLHKRCSYAEMLHHYCPVGEAH